MPENVLKNSHLDGDSFFWQAGRTGILLVHGYTATTAEVRLLAGKLYQQGYSVAGPLLPGHGTTPEQANRCHWRDWVAAAEGSYRSLTMYCDLVVVGGESMGGLIALYLASQHPEVAAVLTYAPALKTISGWRKFLVYLLAPFVPYRDKPLNPPSHADAYWQGYMVNPVRAGRELFRLQTEVRRRLFLIRRPLLVIQGRLDTAVHSDVPEMLVSSVRSNVKEVYWMEQSTHCVILDGEWEQVANLTLDFLHRVLD